MSLEQKLYDLGAECVCGDLLLNRVLVGRYRDGVFVHTPEATEIVAAADAAASGKVEEVVATAPARKPRESKPREPKPKNEPELVEEVKAETAASEGDDPLAGLEDLLGQ